MHARPAPILPAPCLRALPRQGLPLPPSCPLRAPATTSAPCAPQAGALPGHSWLRSCRKACVRCPLTHPLVPLHPPPQAPPTPRLSRPRPAATSWSACSSLSCTPPCSTTLSLRCWRPPHPRTRQHSRGCCQKQGRLGRPPAARRCWRCWARAHRWRRRQLCACSSLSRRCACRGTRPGCPVRGRASCMTACVRCLLHDCLFTVYCPVRGRASSMTACYNPPPGGLWHMCAAAPCVAALRVRPPRALAGSTGCGRLHAPADQAVLAASACVSHARYRDGAPSQPPVMQQKRRMC